MRLETSKERLRVQRSREEPSRGDEEMRREQKAAYKGDLRRARTVGEMRSAFPLSLRRFVGPLTVL